MLCCLVVGTNIDTIQMYICLSIICNEMLKENYRRTNFEIGCGLFSMKSKMIIKILYRYFSFEEFVMNGISKYARNLR